MEGRKGWAKLPGRDTEECVKGLRSVRTKMGMSEGVEDPKRIL